MMASTYKELSEGIMVAPSPGTTALFVYLWTPVVLLGASGVYAQRQIEQQQRAAFRHALQNVLLHRALTFQKSDIARKEEVAKESAQKDLISWLCHEIRYAVNHGTLQSSPPYA